MSTRYDPIDDTDAGGLPPPLPPPTKRSLWLALFAVFVTAAIGVGAAFGFDLCALGKMAGVTLDACKVEPPQ